MFLPELLYCDRNKVINLLSMLISDVLTEYKVIETAGNDKAKDIGGELNFEIGKIAAKYQSDNKKSVQREGIIQSPTASLFLDLHELLEKKDLIQRLVDFDNAIIDQLKVGEFIEIDGEIKLSPIEATMNSMVDFVRKFKNIIASNSEEEMESINQFAEFFEKDTSTLLLDPYADVETAFLTSVSLNNEYLFVDKYELEGEFTLFGRVKRVIGSDKSIDLFKYLPGKMKIMMNKTDSPFIKFFDVFDKMGDSGIEFENISALKEGSYEIKGPLIEINCISLFYNV